MVRKLGGEGMEVWFHEPGERFEIDELDGGGGGWVREEGLNAPALLPVTCERTEGVKGGLKEGRGALGAFLRECNLEWVGRGESEASQIPCFDLSLNYSFGSVDFSVMRDNETDRFRSLVLRISSKAGSFDWTPKDICQAPRSSNNNVLRVTGVLACIGLRLVAN